jgi:hypothetical protein
MGALTIITGVLLAALASQLAFEFRDWTPRWTEILIDRAVRRLPADLQDRMSEERSEFVSDAPGHFAKLKRAFGLGWAARRIVSDLSGKVSGDFWQSACTQIMGLTALVFMAPLLILAIVVVALADRGCPVFERSGHKNFYRFRIADDDISRILSQTTALRELPSLWNVAKGDVTYTWAEMKTIILSLPRLLLREIPIDRGK